MGGYYLRSGRIVPEVSGPPVCRRRTPGGKGQVSGTNPPLPLGSFRAGRNLVAIPGGGAPQRGTGPGRWQAGGAGADRRGGRVDRDQTDGVGRLPPSRLPILRGATVECRD